MESLTCNTCIYFKQNDYDGSGICSYYNYSLTHVDDRACSIYKKYEVDPIYGSKPKTINSDGLSEAEFLREAVKHFAYRLSCHRRLHTDEIEALRILDIKI